MQRYYFAKSTTAIDTNGDWYRECLTFGWKYNNSWAIHISVESRRLSHSHQYPRRKLNPFTCRYRFQALLNDLAMVLRWFSFIIRYFTRPRCYGDSLHGTHGLALESPTAGPFSQQIPSALSIQTYINWQMPQYWILSLLLRLNLLSLPG